MNAKKVKEDTSADPAELSESFGGDQAVRVVLNYQEAPANSMRRTLSQTSSWWPYTSPTEVAMRDARALTPPAELDTMSFTLRSWPSACPDLRDDDYVATVYSDEVIALVREVSGADGVIVMRPHKRYVSSTGHDPAADMEGGLTGTTVATAVHCDDTAASAPQRLELLLRAGNYYANDPNVCEQLSHVELANCRFAFIWVWSNAGDTPVQRKPLAVCDATSVEDEDRLVYELTPTTPTALYHENYSLHALNSERHRWYYYPDMTNKERLVFKVYDQQDHGPRFVFHTAFDDPRTTPEAPAREAVVVRTVAFFWGAKVASPSQSCP